MGAKQISQVGDSDNPPLTHELESPSRILVVEAEPALRQHTAQMLIHSGYAVDAAADAATAWDALCDDTYYDLLISENNLPELAGVELLKKLRAARMFLPMIMTTMTSPPQKFAASPWLQPAATLLKPLAVEQLLETVKNVLGATDVPRAQIAPPSDQRSLPPAGGRQP